MSERVLLFDVCEHWTLIYTTGLAVARTVPHGLEAMSTGPDFERGVQCRECGYPCRVRLATPADLESLVTPAMAARVLGGLTANDLRAASLFISDTPPDADAEEWVPDALTLASKLEEAARRVRESTSGSDSAEPREQE